MAKKVNGGSAIPWKSISWIGFLLVVIIIFHDQVGNLIDRIKSIKINEGGVEIIVDKLEDATKDIPLTLTADSTLVIPDSVSRQVLALRDSIAPSVLATRPDLMLKIGIVEQAQGNTVKAQASFKAAEVEAIKTGDTNIQKAAIKNQEIAKLRPQFEAGRTLLRRDN